MINPPIPRKAVWIEDEYVPEAIFRFTNAYMHPVVVESVNDETKFLLTNAELMCIESMSDCYRIEEK